MDISLLCQALYKAVCCALGLSSSNHQRPGQLVENQFIYPFSALSMVPNRQFSLNLTCFSGL